MTPFLEQLKTVHSTHLQADGIEILQVNLGWVCNQACTHCHVNAGPHRTEVMELETIESILETVQKHNIPTVDITGGAPEINFHFRYLIEQLSGLGTHIIDRCNLTILFEPGMEDLPHFFKKNAVEIVASLPCYLEKNVDAVRGTGTFKKSIKALQLLNDIGYGDENNRLPLKLVYNPSGAFLPPSQEALEDEFKRELSSRYGIKFNDLLTLANIPINRFGDYLIRSGNFEQYMNTLACNFNPGTLDGLMCRHLISVSWDGRLYDCDFNQMSGIPISEECPQTIGDFELEQLNRRDISVGDHCYGCTAGQGSSCSGSLT